VLLAAPPHHTRQPDYTACFNNTPTHSAPPNNVGMGRYASVDASGRYSSPIPTVSGRFGTMVGGLTMGRILIAQVGGMRLRLGEAG
jgi:hypothetical protein